MAFAQLTYRESLRDIEACPGAQAGKLYHMGIRSTVAANTLAIATFVEAADKVNRIASSSSFIIFSKSIESD